MTPAVDVYPERALVDELLEVTARGFDRNDQVTLRASVATDRGTWEGRATFVADDEGRVDPATQAPVEGTYDGVSPMGLVQFARRVERPDLEPPETRVDAFVDGDVVATATCERRLAGDVVVESIADDRLVGTVLRPPGDGPHPGVLLVGGAESGVQTAPRAKLLASRGYAVCSLAYFGAAGLPDDLVEVPLEYFDRAVDWLAGRETVRPEPLGVVGISRGSEAAVLTAARRDDVRTFVGVAPGSHAFQGLSAGFSTGAAWSEDGDPVPSVPFRWGPTDTLRLWGNRLLARPNRFRHAYAGGLADVDEATGEAAALPITEVGGPVLLVSGDDDQVWPSAAFGDRLIARLDDADYPHEYDHLVVEGAGHAIGVPYRPVFGRNVGSDGRFKLALGGTPEGYARADAVSWPRILATLRTGLRVDRDREFATEE